MTKYIVAFISIGLGSVAQYLFKIGVEKIKISQEPVLWAAIKNIPLIGGLACYGVSVLLWFYVLSQMELSKAYPLVSLGYVFTAILGYYLLCENVNLFRIVGIGFIIVGVVFISNS